MSVSLVMLPVALALRVVMGGENFDNWVRSNEVRRPTSIGGEGELKRVVRGAGFDVVETFGMLKTHIDGEREFIWWEQENGKWVAVFTRDQVPGVANRFMTQLEQKAGRGIFVVEEQPTAQAAVEAQPATVLYPTNFRDGALLVSTLERFGVKPEVRANGEITTTLGRSPVTFRPGGENAPYTVEIGNAEDLRAAYQQLGRVDEAYRQGVQSAAIATLKERIKEKNLTVEREETLADRSVVITLAIGGR